MGALEYTQPQLPLSPHPEIDKGRQPYHKG